MTDFIDTIVLKCLVCDKGFEENAEILSLKNTETEETVYVHRDCLDKMGTA